MDKIKIAELLDTYYPCIDGPINVITNYAKNLIKKTDCKMIVPANKRKCDYVDNQPFTVFRCKSGWAPEGYRNGLPGLDGKLKKFIKEEKFDILHTHSPFGMGSFAIKIGKKYDVPVVATLHTKYYDDFLRVLHGNKVLSKFMLRRIMKVYNKADSVWTVNNASCEVLRQYGFKGDIVVMRNGTDLKYPENASELIEKVNAAHSLAGKKNVFIFVGRTVMYKNLGLMAEALKILKDKGEDFTMIMVGAGPDEQILKDKIKSLDLTDRFIFAGTIRDRELLQGYYLRSDLFLFPSTFDTSSLVPIEAAAHKLPVLLIENSYTAEGIKDNFNGFLAKETPEAYAEKIMEIIHDQNKLKAVGEEAHRSVYRTWESVAEETYAKYEEIIKKFKANKK